MQIKFQNVSLKRMFLAFLFLGIKVSVGSECNSTLPLDCSELKKANATVDSGVFTVRLSNASSCAEAGGYMNGTVCCKEVLCDMETMGGGWMVFQKRFNGSIDFYQTWSVYQSGFGHINGEFWAGNNFLYHFSSQKTYELLVELYQAEKGCSLYALYSAFALANTETYDLLLGNYIQGTAGDELTFHATLNFSTKDRDNDVSQNNNCAQWYNGAWWYKNCHRTHLNGLYLNGCTTVFAKGMVWKSARGFFYSFARTEMKLRPNSYSSGSTALDDKFCKDTTFNPCPMDCNWNPWSEWSSNCEMGGERFRSRTEIPKQHIYAEDCQGSNTEIEQCKRKKQQHFAKRSSCRVASSDVYAEFIPLTKEACAMECFRRKCQGWNFNPLTSHCELFSEFSNTEYSNDFDCYF